ncbi:aminotransferase, partial [Leptospira jelokensis]
VLFEDDVLKSHMTLPIQNEKVKNFVAPLMEKAALDRRFVLHLLASAGICVVPLSSFCCSRNGFRVTLLEEDDAKYEWIYKTLAENIKQYLAS